MDSVFLSNLSPESNSAPKCLYLSMISAFFLHEQHSPERLTESPDNMTAGEEAEQSGMLWWIQRQYQHWCRNDWYLDQSTDAFPLVICWYVDTCELLTAFVNTPLGRNRRLFMVKTRPSTTAESWSKKCFCTSKLMPRWSPTELCVTLFCLALKTTVEM